MRVFAKYWLFRLLHLGPSSPHELDVARRMDLIELAYYCRFFSLNSQRPMRTVS